MKCPFCGSTDNQVKDSRQAENGAAIRRRRHCNNCSMKFSTFEHAQTREIKVLKYDGQKEMFDRNKVIKSMEIALNKRNVESNILEFSASKIVQVLENTADEKITGVFIGQLVMEELEKIDPVGFIRYASVYKSFSSVKDFKKFISEFNITSK